MRHRINDACAVDHVNRNMKIIYGNTVAKCEIIHRITHAALVLGNEPCFEQQRQPTHSSVDRVVAISQQAEATLSMSRYLPGCSLQEHAGLIRSIDHLTAVASDPRDTRSG